MDIDIYAYIGLMVKSIRIKRELTQGELAKGTGLDQTLISLTESGNQKIQIDRLYGIARCLEVDISVFLPGLGGEKEPIDQDTMNKIMGAVKGMALARNELERVTQELFD